VALLPHCIGTRLLQQGIIGLPYLGLLQFTQGTAFCFLFVGYSNECLSLLCCLQVGASNELPESEELDALYDRFLIRRSVAQVSSSQLGNLARLAAGTRLVAEPASNGASSNGAGTPPGDAEAGPGLDLEDFR